MVRKVEIEMSKKEERKVRADERAVQQRTEIEERAARIKKKMNGRELSLEDKIVLAKADKYKLDDSVRELDDELGKVEEFSSDEEEVQALADRFLAQDFLCVACASEGQGREAEYVLPYLVLLRKLYPDEEFPNGEILKRIGQLPQEAALEGMYCRECKPEVEKLLADCQEVQRHANNAYLFHVKGFAKSWSSLRVKNLNFGREKMQRRLENAMERRDSLMQKIKDMESILARNAEIAAERKKRVGGTLSFLNA